MEVCGELIAVDLAGDHLLGEHRPRLKARHRRTVRAVRHVHDDDMGVEMRIEFAAGMLGEAGEDQSAGGLMDDRAAIATAQRRMLFQIIERGPDRLFVRGDDAIIALNQCHDRYRFRRIDRKVPTRMMLDFAVGTVPAKLLVTDLAVQQLLEYLRLDQSRQTEFVGDPATPFRMLVAALRIIIAHRIIAGDIAGRALQAAGMDHAGRAGRAGPFSRS